MLSKWKKEKPFNAKDLIHSLEEQLEAAQSSGDPSAIHVRSVKKELAAAYKAEEEFWCQKAKEKWAQAGDRNTKYFNAIVKAARTKNSIEKLEDELGNIHRTKALKGDVAANYFQNLFLSNNPLPAQDFFQGFSNRVSAEMNDLLVREVTDDEITEAVFSIDEQVHQVRME